MKNLIIIGFVLYVFSRKAQTTSTKTENTTTPATPKKTPAPIINNGGTGGGGGGSTGGEENYFRFYKKTNSNPYPTTNPVEVPQIDGYIAVQFASWSINSLMPASYENAQKKSFMRFKMYDSDNNLVCDIQNMQANYHPNYAPYLPAGSELRHNNHKYEYRKYLPFGAYRIEYENISPQPIEQHLRFGTQGEGGNVYQDINEHVSVGSRTFNINLVEQNNYRLYEFDCNPY